MNTKAWLEGHPFDLEDLAQLLATGDVHVVHDANENAYYLSATEIDNPPDGTTFYEVAQRLLPHINGIGRVNWKLSLEANETKDLTYDWHYFWR